MEREEPGLLESIEMLRRSSALAVLAHPVRLPVGDHPDALRALLDALIAAGLQGLEVWHSEHSPAQQELYERLAQSFGLEATGGSDFHGSHKPSITLGAGIDGHVCVSKARLDSMRAASGSAVAGTTRSSA